MLQAINDRIKGWLGIAVVILIGLPFALWGIQSYLDDAGPRYAAKVNNIEISQNEFERTVAIQRQALTRRNNGILPVDEKTLREMTLTQLINQRLLENVTYENEYRISDSILSAKLKQQFSLEGVFDRNLLEAAARSNGMTIPMYERSLRNELRLQQMESAITNSAFVTKGEANYLASLKDQTRDISVLTFNMDHFATDITVTADEIKQYYEANKQRFMLPEKVKVDYVELTSESLAENVAISEKQIAKMYEDYHASAAGREQREASHILISSSVDKVAAQNKIESIKKELEQGADFAELANKYSQDPGSAEQGGNLGWVSPGEMVKPFEQALFAMEKGTVSGIVESPFGFHIIKLNDVKSAEIVPLEVKRHEFEEELKSDSVASIFYDQSERLASIAYENPSSLDVVVDALALKTQTSNFFTRDTGDGITSNKKVRDIAFSPLVLEQGNNSDVIEITPTDVIVLRINEHVPASPIPLADVSSKIENILKAQSAHRLTLSAALDVKAKIESGMLVDTLIAPGIKVENIEALKRSDDAKVSDPKILMDAFNLVPSSDEKPLVKEVELMTGDVALVLLDKINALDSTSQDQQDLVRNEVLREKAIRDFTNTVYAIQKSATIDKNVRAAN